MSALVEFTSEGGPVLIEVTAGDGATRRGLRATDVPAEAVVSFGSLAEHLRGPVQAVLGAFAGAASGIDEVEVGFSLSVRADAGIVVSRVGADANFHVTVRWHPSRDAGP
jgi:hypothetical protein